MATHGAEPWFESVVDALANQDYPNLRVTFVHGAGDRPLLERWSERIEHLDLVEVAPGQTPVCKVLDYGKMRFENQKKKAANRKNQRTQSLKEIKMRPNIDTHDYEVKTKAMRKFFDRGDKVKVTVRFRGREMAHMDRGMDLLQRVKEDFEEDVKVEFEPKTEGRMMTMVLAPKS